MGTYPLSELREEVKLHFADRPDLTDAQVDRALNIQQERMARAYDFEDLKVVDSGTLPFTSTPADDKFFPFSTLGSGNQEPREVYSFRLDTADGRARKLTQLSARKFDKLVPEPEFHGVRTPTMYTIWADKFELYPVQDIAYPYELRMSKWPTTLVNVNDKSDFNRKDDILIIITISWLFNRFGEYERAGRFFGIFNALWRDATNEDLGMPDREIGTLGGKETSIYGEKYWLDPFVRSVR